MGSGTVQSSSSLAQRFRLSTSKNYRYARAGALFGALAGVACAFAYGPFLLELVGISATMGVIFGLPLVFAAVAAVFFAAVFRFFSSERHLGHQIVNFGVKLVHEQSALDKRQLVPSGFREDLSSANILSCKDYGLRIQQGRYAIWATIGGVLGVSACLFAAYFFMAPITAVLGLSAVYTSAYALMGYASVSGFLGGFVGALLFGGVRVGLGRMVDWVAGSKNAYRYCGVKATIVQPKQYQDVSLTYNVVPEEDGLFRVQPHSVAAAASSKYPSER